MFEEFGVRLPFSPFIAEVLKALRVAPSQLNPNSWAFIRGFEILCQALEILPTYNLFFYFYKCSPPNKKGLPVSTLSSWVALTAKPLKSRLKAWKSNTHEQWKGRYFKILDSPAIPHLMRHAETGEMRFPPYWTESPNLTVNVEAAALTDEERDVVEYLSTLGVIPVSELISAHNRGYAAQYLLTNFAVSKEEMRNRARQNAASRQNANSRSAEPKKKRARKENSQNARDGAPVVTIAPVGEWHEVPQASAAQPTPGRTMITPPTAPEIESQAEGIKSTSQTLTPNVNIGGGKQGGPTFSGALDLGGGSASRSTPRAMEASPLHDDETDVPSALLFAEKHFPLRQLMAESANSDCVELGDNVIRHAMISSSWAAILTRKQEGLRKALDDRVERVQTLSAENKELAATNKALIAEKAELKAEVDRLRAARKKVEKARADEQASFAEKKKSLEESCTLAIAEEKKKGEAAAKEIADKLAQATSDLEKARLDFAEFRDGYVDECSKQFIEGFKSAKAQVLFIDPKFDVGRMGTWKNVTEEGIVGVDSDGEGEDVEEEGGDAPQ